MVTPPLKIGDAVIKVSGYLYPGQVVAVFKNLKGDDRFVVECVARDCAGMLHIFNREQLKKI